jgi:hypothetical protein
MPWSSRARRKPSPVGCKEEVAAYIPWWRCLPCAREGRSLQEERDDPPLPPGDPGTPSAGEGRVRLLSPVWESRLCS